MSLVHHVCQQTAGLESLFLISKSNCAFANFPDEDSCLVAQQKLNDTWYMSVRLVSRLRKNAVEGVQGVAAPTGPTALTVGPSQQHTLHVDGNQTDGVDPDDDTTNAAGQGETENPKKSPSPTSVIVDGSGKSTPKGRRYEEGLASTPTSGSDAATKRNKFFILKSLTAEDLELSVRTGIWATQSHNEETLNAAFGVSIRTFGSPTVALSIANVSSHTVLRKCISVLLRKQVRRILWLRPNDIGN